MSKQDRYHDLIQQVRSLLSDESDLIAATANVSAVLYHGLPEVNWVGFYFQKGEELVLGPFQGKPACSRIPLGKGVCGTAAADRKTLIVEDVHQFSGHIACDMASNSELVVPLIQHDRLLGVLDLDSPLPARFDAADAAGLEAIVALLVEQSADSPDLIG